MNKYLVNLKPDFIHYIKVNLRFISLVKVFKRFKTLKIELDISNLVGGHNVII